MSIHSKNLDNMTKDSGESQVTGEMPDQVFTYSVSQKLQSNQFIKEHYDFVNWIGSDGNTYDDEQEMSSYVGDDLELSAQWAPSKYHVYFDGNCETSVTMDPQEFTYGIPQTLMQNIFSNENFIFDGWIDQNGNSYQDEAEVSLSSDLWLTANWSRITSTFTFYRTPEQESSQEAPESPEASPESSHSGPLLMQAATTPQQVQSQITMIYL